jgi:hypothetical protein
MPADTGTNATSARAASMFERRMLWIGAFMALAVGVMTARLFSVTVTQLMRTCMPSTIESARPYFSFSAGLVRSLSSCRSL